MSPPEDLEAALVAAETDADEHFDQRPVGSGVLPCGLATHWVEFELLADGAPAAGVRYELRLPGRVAQGTLNSRGKVRVEGITQAGTCTITFPELDADAEEGGSESESEETPTDTANDAGSEGESTESESESESAEPRGTLYVPGESPAPVPLDASHCYRLATWDLVALSMAPATDAPAEGGVGSGAGEPPGEEEREEQDDWDVTSIGFSDEA